MNIKDKPNKVMGDEGEWTSKDVKIYYWLGVILGFLLGMMVTVYVMGYSDLIG
jgi:hypothetical protein